MHLHAKHYKLLGACLLLQIPILLGQLKTYAFEELDSLQGVQKRPVVVFIHTDWCRYCQMMKHTTFQNDSVIKLLNEKFYFVSFNAEERRDVTLNGHVFHYQPTGIHTGIHQLADHLATINGKLAYPTISVLTPDNKIVVQYPQFISAKDLINLLKQIE